MISSASVSLAARRSLSRSRPRFHPRRHELAPTSRAACIPPSVQALTTQRPPARSICSSVPRYSPPSRPASQSISSGSSTSPPSTHYDLFPETLPQGPPPGGSFDVDTRALRREFLRLQAQAHPDTKPAGERAAAEAASSRINDAYRTLSSPLLRAQYILGLRGGGSSGDDGAVVEEGALTADMELLGEVMEAREGLEEAQSQEEVDGMRERNEERISACVEALGGAFAEDDLAKAKEEAIRLRYWMNIQDSIVHWEKGKPHVSSH